MTFTIPLTRAQFEAARAKLAAAGQTVNGDNGTLCARGVKASFGYFEGPAELLIDIERKPFFVTEAKVESIMRDWFKNV